MEWKNILDEYTAQARTKLISLYVRPDVTHSPGLAKIRYHATVETISGGHLTSRDDIATMEEARAWCEGEYKALLLAELDRLA